MTNPSWAADLPVSLRRQACSCYNQIAGKSSGGGMCMQGKPEAL